MHLEIDKNTIMATMKSTELKSFAIGLIVAMVLSFAAGCLVVWHAMSQTCCEC